MSGQTWHNGGSPLGAPLLISVLLHGLCFALAGLALHPQVRIPLPPQAIKVGLVFKPAPRPEPQRVKAPSPVPAKTHPQQQIKKKSRPRPLPAPPPPTPVLHKVKPKPAARVIRKQPLTEPEMLPAEPIVRQAPATTPAETVEPAAEQRPAVDQTAPRTRRQQAAPVARSTQPLKQQHSTAYQDYLREVRQQIDRAKRYPLMARRGGQQGSVLVAFEIDAGGKLERCNILRSSGFKQLDRAALKAVRSAAPFASRPEEAGGTLALQLPVRFALRR